MNHHKEWGIWESEWFTELIYKLTWADISKDLTMIRDAVISLYPGCGGFVSIPLSNQAIIVYLHMYKAKNLFSKLPYDVSFLCNPLATKQKWDEHIEKLIKDFNERLDSQW